MQFQRQLLASLMQGTWQDPDTKQAVKLPLQDIIIEVGLVDRAQSLHEALDIKGVGLVVSDANTHDVLGHKLRQELKISNLKEYIFKESPKADEQSVEIIRQQIQRVDYIIAVGSGTINDICKYASYQLGIPYIVWGTAPSMNGYASANAAITVNGHKQSLACKPPQAIYLDSNILAAAPTRLIQSGVGDALCRSTAQADWFLSHKILNTPYKGAPFALLQGDEAYFMEAGERLINGDRDAVTRLAYNLILSGIGMLLCKGSYPASQGEHLIAHALEMKYPKQMAEFTHGEVVGVTTLTMAARQEGMMASSTPPALLLKTKGQIELFWGGALGGSCWKSVQDKFPNQLEIDLAQASLNERWEKIRLQWQAMKVSCGQLELILHAINACMVPKDLHMSLMQYTEIVEYSPTIRGRFTSLDLVS